MPSSRACRAAVVALALISCSSGDDPLEESFDAWCGAAPCGWAVDQGGVAPTRTWHREDLAVDFVATSSQISRVLEEATAPCFRVESIADVVPEAGLRLELDFNNDRVADFSQLFAAASWEPATFIVNAPSSFRGVRFIVRKDGVGRAVLAQLRVLPSDTCTGQPTLLMDGSRCDFAELCASGRCSAGTCGL